MQTILLVEDNPITRKLVRFTLENRGYGVSEAIDGKSALAAVSERVPDLILQDLVLPDFDGFELARQLRAQLAGRPVPILAFSGFVSKLEEARISAVGFDDLIVKPIEPSRLIQTVQAHMPEPSEPQPPQFGKGRRILVADDDPLQAKLAAFRLTRLGFDVTWVADGAEALESVRERPPELILTDIMMPRVDGFRLCLEIRKDPRLRNLPVVLMTSSYIEDADSQLARQAGATSFVLRTPGLHEVIEAVRSALVSDTRATEPTVDQPQVEREHAQRVIQQLERQVRMNAGISQRCALLSAELSILSGISSALTRHEDFDAALDEVLAACFDAGGISTGVLYLFEPGGIVRARAFGTAKAWDSSVLGTFFGDFEGLRASMQSVCVVVPSESPQLARATRGLSDAGIRSALAVPLAYRDELMGALFLASKTTPLGDEDRLAFVTGVASQIGQAVALLRTFSAKSASERGAQETATTLRAMMDSMADGVIVADDSGAILYSNAAAEQLLPLHATGRASEQRLSDHGLFLPDRVTPYPANEQPLARAIRGERVERLELFMRQQNAPDGAWLSVNAQPVIDASGRRRGGVAVFRDVTTEKTAHEQLMMSDRLASIGMLAAGVAHEINNPLSAVMGNLELAASELAVLSDKLGERGPSQDLLDEVNEARSAAERVQEIMRDLKIFSRAEEDTKSNVDVRLVLETSVRMAWNEIRHRARLVKDLREVPFVEANESRLGQLFLNLIVNAAQSIPEGRIDENEIHVVTKLDAAGRVVIEVSDTGSGIAGDSLGRIFTPFFTTKPVGIGTGLGLAICQRIVSAARGEIQVSSQLGVGTVFRVTFPPAVSGVAEAPRAQQPAGAASRPGRVLAIDDDRAVLSIVQRVLSPEHEVVAALGAIEALERIAAGERFDVIICDLMMPRMTGMDLHAELLRVAPDQVDKLIFLTGGAFTPRALAFLDRIPNQLIEKPFGLVSLRGVVNQRIQ